MHFQWGGSRPWKEQQDKARAVAAEQGKKTGEKLAQVAGAKPPDAKSPIEEYNDKLIAAARKQAADAAKKGEAGAAPPEAPPPPVEKGETAEGGLKSGLAPMLGEHLRETQNKGGLAPMLGRALQEAAEARAKTQEQQNAERLAQTGRPLFPPGTKFNKRGEAISSDLADVEPAMKSIRAQRDAKAAGKAAPKGGWWAKSDPTPLEEMKAKIDAAKTGDLQAGGALKKSGADFDRALAPIGSSGLAPGAGGDSVTNNSGGNRNMNVQATNNVTINGNHNKSPGSLARRFSDKSERFYGDLGRNNRAMVT